MALPRRHAPEHDEARQASRPGAEPDWHALYEIENPAEVDAYLADPLCGTTPTAGLLRDMVGGMRFNCQPAHLRQMDTALPVLFLSGGEDAIGGRGRGVIRAYRSFLDAGMTDVTLKLYPGCRHELLHDACCSEVLQDILCWLESRT